MSACVETRIEPYVVALEPVAFFRPSEEVDLARVSELVALIETCGEWRVPLPVEATTGIVMDGNHRLHAAAILGLVRLPCVPLLYADQRVSVCCWQSGAPFELERIAALERQRAVLPYKTTRHRFDPPLPGCRIPLALLRR